MDDEVWLIKLCLKPFRPWKNLIRGGFVGLSLSDYLIGTLAVPCSPHASLFFSMLAAITLAAVNQALACTPSSGS